MKPVLKSKTTATVGGAAAGTSAFVLLLLSLIPASIREAWGPDSDAALIWLITTLGTAAISRLVAMLRGK